MKEITKSRAFFLKQFRSTCPHCKAAPCPCAVCEKSAEVWAYINELIPESCQTKGLKDWVGLAPDHKAPVISDEVLIAAKKKLVQYCWGKIEFDGDTDFDTKEMLKKSVIGKRREFGHSLVIHGNAMVSTAKREVDENDNSFLNKGVKQYQHTPHVYKKPLGKTLLASIVLKEAIRRRILPKHACDTYEWVSFPTLKARVMSKDDAVIDYLAADWLVVDNIARIDKGSENSKAYQLEKIDAVFMERIEHRLPTILVFQFDIDQYPALHEEVGLGMAQIVADRNTTKISLTSSAQ